LIIAIELSRSLVQERDRYYGTDVDAICEQRKKIFGLTSTLNIHPDVAPQISVGHATNPAWLTS
jgi:hypothetical protein